MSSSDNTTNASNIIQADQQPARYISFLEQQHNTVNAHVSEDATIDNKDTSPILDGYQVEPSASCFFLCTNMRARYSVAIWCFFGFFCLYAMRVNLSVAIVAMVAPQSSLNQSVQACPVVHTNSTKPPAKYEFEWDPNKQGLVLGAFFYGYISTQIIGGNLAERFGGKWIFGGGILISSILTLLTPLAARINYKLLIAIRVIIGMASGPAFPSAAALWGKWIPTAERSRIPPAAQSGTSIGIIFTTPLVSIMSENGFIGGWPSAFYVFGIASCIWFIGWCFFSFNSPAEHPRISKEERSFLREHIPHHPLRNRTTPWKQIACCPSVYGIGINHVCFNFIYYTLLTSLPTYFATILNFNLHQNGLIFALPYCAQFLTIIAVGQTVDRLRARNSFSITTLRKAQAIIGTIGSCSCLVAIGYMNCNKIAAVVCCIFAVGFLGAQTCGPIIAHLDIASNYAGTIVGITNSLATIPGFVGPYVVGAITNNNQTIHAWRLIFIISAGIGAFGCLAFCILFNGEEKPWNRIEHEVDTNESTS
ncbi:unnamed protein product [Rotaria magnacalcarata]|uniref:Sialin n=1 Tax=Rotaria magnacalcarata TaxID=392030 RepID=A0A815V2M5_9BILA|nr:unnamed protein product [Rotaria magnacalcarata]CAF1545464.1 unnamed protein product [Rotaria magnacalcarata]CAF3915839.1 unnamed protein product [Rotaria magnacalcarata]CAF3920274.1 unnamed protein product [Rotaria magnacalcarata]